MNVVKRNLKVVGYARVSTDLQLRGKVFDSIEAQKSIIHQYVAAHPGMELVEMFTDPGTSGSNMRRPGMQALLKRVQDGDIAYVLCYKLDRISRDKFDYFEFEKIIRGYGVGVHYTNDCNPDNSPFGSFIRTMMAGMAELERGQIVQRITIAMYELFKQGYRTGGRTPPGYACGEKKCTLVVDEAAAVHIREIFQLFSDGMRPSEIATHMAQKYKTTPTVKGRKEEAMGGGAYSENYVRQILQNPVYAGYVCWWSAEKGLELNDGLHEALVDRAAWERTQEKLARQKRCQISHIRMRGSHLLKKYLFCSCGAMMTTSFAGKRRKDGTHYQYYVCSAKNKFHAQSACRTRIGKKIIESVIFSALGFIAAKNIDRRRLKQGGDEYPERIAEEKKGLLAESGRNNALLQNLIDELAEFEGNAVMKEALRARASKLSDEIERLSMRLREIETEQTLLGCDKTVGQSQINAIFQDFDALQEHLEDSERSEILRHAVKKLVLVLRNESEGKRDFMLAVIFTPEYASLGHLEVLFSVDNSRGYSQWHIYAPFDLKCKGGGNGNMSSSDAKGRPIKHHWLHQIMKWRKKMRCEDISIRTMADKMRVKKTTLGRKIKLLDDLSHEAVAFILSLRHASQIEKVSFKKLKVISLHPDDKQIRLLKNLMQTAP